MKAQKLRSDLYTASVWAVFTLGATQLALVLAGALICMIVSLSCAVLLAVFLMKTEAPDNKSFRWIAKMYLLYAAILLVLNVLYAHLVFLKAGLSYIIFFCVNSLLSTIPLLITLPFTSKRSHVSG